jgi:hypothetical protein
MKAKTTIATFGLRTYTDDRKSSAVKSPARFPQPWSLDFKVTPEQKKKTHTLQIKSKQRVHVNLI